MLTEKKRTRRNLVIQSAREVFKNFGYRKTTMNDIAKACGKGKSSIYYYFDSKDKIFNAVILSEAVIYRKKVLEAINSTDNPLDKLKRYIMIRLQTDKILSNFHRALNDPDLRHIKFVHKLKTLYDKEEFRIFSDILKYGGKKRFFKVYDFKYAAVGIVAAMRGIESTLLLNSEDPDIDEKVENVINIVLYGIVKR